MVNGAGLAMATMDIIKYAGGSPGELPRRGRRRQCRPDQERLPSSCSDPNVKAILINIFGGILRCDTLATGVVAAARDSTSRCRSWCAWKGTNVEQGRKILPESG
jgi:succinyl-CoA synthetase beta subunit